MTNPAFANWVLMVKGDEEKMVHPGNVVNHERFGWVRKYPEKSQEAPVDDKAYQSLTLPELTEMIVEHEADGAAVSTETDVPPTEEAPPDDLSVLVTNTSSDSPRKRTPRKAKK